MQPDGVDSHNFLQFPVAFSSDRCILSNTVIPGLCSIRAITVQGLLEPRDCHIFALILNEFPNTEALTVAGAAVFLSGEVGSPRIPLRHQRMPGDSWCSKT